MNAKESSQILVIEDDDSIAEAIETIIERLGHRSTRCANGRDGLRQFFDIQPDLVLLDVGLPQMDGWQVLERIRELSDVPVLMLTARDLEQDKVRGLLGGADDYLTKPFGVRELGARISVLLRRARRSVEEPSGAMTFHCGDVQVDLASREVLVNGSVVALTPLEFRLLETFMRHPRQALSTEQLLDLVWNDPLAVGVDRVKFTVLRLRRKLGWQKTDTSPIEAVRGYGYRYQPPQ